MSILFFYDSKKKFYEDVIREELITQEKVQLRTNVVSRKKVSNVQIPQVNKVVVHCSNKACIRDTRTLLNLILLLDTTTRQRPIFTRTRAPNAEFKIKAGMPIGVKTTLRGEKAYSFLFDTILFLLPKQTQQIKKAILVPSDTNTINIGVENAALSMSMESFTKHPQQGMQITIVSNTREQYSKSQLISSFFYGF